MKKTANLRLTLTKETLRKLHDGQVVEAAGATGHSCGEHDGAFCFITEPTQTCNG